MSEPMVNIHEARTHFYRLLRRVEAGAEVVIARAGRPIARLVPFQPRTAPREPGLWRGRVSLAPDFDRAPVFVVSDFERDPPASPGGSP